MLAIEERLSVLPSRPRRLESADYQALVDRCEVIERDGFGEKVLRTPDGLMIKIFRRKRLLTTATFFPYALRFIRNARLLSNRNIATVTVLDHVYCPSLRKHLVTYRPLPGTTLRSALTSDLADAERLIDRVAGFIATLHQKGVYFRSLHFGNIIVFPAGEMFGLIDVADMTVRSGPLANRLRVRNLRHILRYREDAEALERFGCRSFVDRYLAASGMSSKTAARFIELLNRSLPTLTL